jgi:hypothetical protein
MKHLAPVGLFKFGAGLVTVASGGLLVEQSQGLADQIVVGGVLALLTLAGVVAILGFRVIWGRLDTLDTKLDEVTEAVRQLVTIHEMCPYVRKAKTGGG